MVVRRQSGERRPSSLGFSRMVGVSSDGQWTQEQVKRDGLRPHCVQFLCQDVCGLMHSEHM